MKEPDNTEVLVAKQDERSSPEHILFYLSRIKDWADRFLIQELESRGVYGLVPSHGNILVGLYRQDSMTMHQLAQWIKRDKSTVTTLVGKLIKLGLVHRQPDPEDKRVTWVALTSDGRALLPIFQEIRERFMERFYGKMPRRKQQQIIKLLAEIYEGL